MKNKIEETIKRIQRVALDADIKIDDGSVRHFHRGHEYVEIGGMKWATMNIGAKCERDKGLYFQWGGIKGYTAKQVGNTEKGKKYFYWGDYEFNPSGNGLTFTKYDDIDGYKTVLDPLDDAAHIHWGGNWRMPTKEEFTTLITTANTAWTKVNGVKGLLCTDNNDSSKKLFFPAAGVCGKGSVNDVGSRGYYWSSSLFFGNTMHSHSLCFNKNGIIYWQKYNFRFFGFTVRGVIDNG